MFELKVHYLKLNEEFSWPEKKQKKNGAAGKFINFAIMAKNQKNQLNKRDIKS